MRRWLCSAHPESISEVRPAPRRPLPRSAPRPPRPPSWWEESAWGQGRAAHWPTCRLPPFSTADMGNADSRGQEKGSSEC